MQMVCTPSGIFSDPGSEYNLRGCVPPWVGVQGRAQGWRNVALLLPTACPSHRRPQRFLRGIQLLPGGARQWTPSQRWHHAQASPSQSGTLAISLLGQCCPLPPMVWPAAVGARALDEEYSGL
eukprot:7224541-Alexandrium_andersonii.AAC.1